MKNQFLESTPCKSVDLKIVQISIWRISVFQGAAHTKIEGGQGGVSAGFSPPSPHPSLITLFNPIDNPLPSHVILYFYPVYWPVSKATVWLMPTIPIVHNEKMQLVSWKVILIYLTLPVKKPSFTM